jgi:hypothetical protein
MARVEIPAPGDLVMDSAGNVRNGVAVTLTLAGTVTAATHYSALTGGTSTTGGLVTSSDGTIVNGSGNRRYVATGSYDLTIAGLTRRIEANRGDDVSGTEIVRASGGDDAAAITAALALGSVYLPDPLYLIASEVVVPNLYDLNGAGLERTKIRATAAGARIRYTNRGGKCGNFYFDGNATATNAVVFECTERTLENIRANDTLGDIFQVGTLTATAQNNTFINVKGHNAIGSIWTLDGGAANNDFTGCYGEKAARWIVEIKRSGASPSGGGTQPFNNRFFGGILERPGAIAPLAPTAGLGVVGQTAGSDTTFFGTDLSSFGITTVDIPLVYVGLTDAGATASRLQLVGSMFLDGNPATSTGIKVETGGSLYITGRPFVRNVLYGLDFSDTATIEQDRLSIDSTVTNVYRQRGTQKAHRRITDLIVAESDWPTSSIAVTCDRSGRLDVISAATGGWASGTLYLVRSKVPFTRGVPISSLTFLAGSTGVTTPTNNWACLVDASLNVLAKSADDGTTWAANATKTFTFASDYVPTSTAPLYLGLVTVAATPPSLMASVGGQANVSFAPRLAGPSTTALTNPASLGSTAAAVGIAGHIPFAYAL